MRYLGNKTKLLPFIDHVFDKYKIQGKIFFDPFAGTAAVADHMKSRFTVIANDYMHFSARIAEAKVLNRKEPNFEKFRELYNESPFDWLNNKKYEPSKNGFIYNTYSPAGGRMYFTESNAAIIDGIRLDIERLYKSRILNATEYAYLLASLVESVLRVSNTAGTYQAYFKFWETRAIKSLTLVPLEIEESASIDKGNRVYCQDANQLIREVSGDIAYLDPPYTTTQYANMYHVLETIVKYDQPTVFGKTGRRQNRVLSGYSNKHNAIYEFEDLFRQLDFDHIIVSYSNQSIIPLQELVTLASRFAVNGTVHLEQLSYREYASNNVSYKGENEGLKETILYFRKDRKIRKSPLNYSGSKDGVMGSLTKYMPKHIGTFVDAMGGAFNVGANVVATKKVVYNENNPYIYSIIKMLLQEPGDSIVNQVQLVIRSHHMRKKGREAYTSLRDEYNNSPTPLLLFVLHIFSFQNIIRFNSAGQMNTPVGNNEFSRGLKTRILQFQSKTPNPELLLGSYQDLKYTDYPADTLFYFDPPYYLSTAEYNDGKRGFTGWNTDSEIELLSTLLQLDQLGYKFMLSNILEHKGRTHHILKDWAKEHHFHIYALGLTGIKYPRAEVLITNFDPLSN
ncbi:DNA adenine methylase [Bifidobacterium kimbladii]|uniref:site-specific DNA-methyltransferase (adenine-specific) n=1 Tax=Bifidobacterium asteroides TaxID=1684 RepID=A0A0F4L5W8_9BIFI|nr:DNA adenine methylase [Bifidobacterium asteroides]KJY52961.1 Modification methylase LlaI [Bifidobacterium asteroides]